MTKEGRDRWVGLRLALRRGFRRRLWGGLRLGLFCVLSRVLSFPRTPSVLGPLGYCRKRFVEDPRPGEYEHEDDEADHLRPPSVRSASSSVTREGYAVRLVTEKGSTLVRELRVEVPDRSPDGGEDGE